MGRQASNMTNKEKRSILAGMGFQSVDQWTAEQVNDFYATHQKSEGNRFERPAKAKQATAKGAKARKTVKKREKR